MSFLLVGDHFLKLKCRSVSSMTLTDDHLCSKPFAGLTLKVLNFEHLQRQQSSEMCRFKLFQVQELRNHSNSRNCPLT